MYPPSKGGGSWGTKNKNEEVGCRFPEGKWYFFLFPILFISGTKSAPKVQVHMGFVCITNLFQHDSKQLSDSDQG